MLHALREKFAQLTPYLQRLEYNEEDPGKLDEFSAKQK